MLALSHRRFRVVAAFLLVTIGALPITPSQAAGPTVATISVTAPYDLQAAYGSVWVLSGAPDDYSVVNRVDPATDRVTARWRLPGASAGLAVGFGSVWASLYDANQVVRIDPTSGRTLATIAVGLQPEALHIAFGSVWVANHHGQSVSRIDPVRNRVVAQPTVGDPHAYRAGPQLMTDDGHRLYVGTSINQALTTITPAGTRVAAVWPTSTDQFCTDLLASGSYVWSVDPCSNTLYRLDPAHRRVTAFGYGSGVPDSATLLDGTLWVAYDAVPAGDGTPASGGALQARDPVTGHLERTLSVGGDASVVRAVDGQLWVGDATNNVVRRITPS